MVGSIKPHLSNPNELVPLCSRGRSKRICCWTPSPPSCPPYTQRGRSGQRVCQRLQDGQPAGPGWCCDLGHEPESLVRSAFLESVNQSTWGIQCPESSYAAEFPGSPMGSLRATQEVFGCLESFVAVALGGGVTGIPWVEARDAAKILPCPGCSPQHKSTWHQMSTVLRLRSPGLNHPLDINSHRLSKSTRSHRTRPRSTPSSYPRSHSKSLNSYV